MPHELHDPGLDQGGGLDQGRLQLLLFGAALGPLLLMVTLLLFS